jgi:hypothetical protein
MERLTPSNCGSLIEAYSAVYNEDLRSKLTELNEEKRISEFLEFIDSLVEEGYDLSEYTYDELYESYLNEFWGAVAKLGSKLGPAALKGIKQVGNYGKRAVKTAWQGSTKIDPKTGESKFVPGAKQPAKELLSKAGKAAVPTAAALGLDQYLTGGKGREWAGAAVQGIRQAGHSIPGPDSAKKALTAKPKPSKPSSNERNPFGLNQDLDLFDLIKGHLLDEGYADTEEAALKIMANMSEEWRESIVEKHSTFGYNADDPLDDFDQFVNKGPKTNKQKRNAIELNNKILSKPGMPVKGV